MTEPNLMPFQDQPFNGDKFICEKFIELKEKYNLNVAIETGSCLYTTTKFLAGIFEKVYTVEINEKFAMAGKHRIKDLSNIYASIDDSVNWITNLMQSKIQENDRVIFFLDAHWNEICPLQDELNEISKIKTRFPPIITIHDFFTGNTSLGFDSYKNQPFTWDWIEPKIKQIENALGCSYSYEFNNESCGAQRGIIYIIPKNQI